MAEIDKKGLAFASLYDETPIWSSRFGALIFSHLELGHDLRVMDLGCGTGFPLFELANMLGRTCKLTGVDVWDEALRHAELKRKFYGFDHVELVRASGADLPFANEEFDLIVSNLGLNNFDDPKKTALECARVLRLGGRLVLTTNLRGHMKEFYDEYRSALFELGLDHLLPKLQEHEDNRATPESIASLLGEAGFSLVKQVKDQFQWRFVDGTALLKHSFIRIGFMDAWRDLIEARDVDKFFVTLERRLNRAAKDRGLSLTIPMLYVEARKSRG